MTRYYTYIIISGDRIDKVSQKFYGRVDNVEPVFEANPWLKFKVSLEEYVGRELVIPIEEEAETVVTAKHGLRAL